MRKSIICETEEGETIDYWFAVNQVEECNMGGAYGEYIPVRLTKTRNIIPVINIRFDADHSTIVHEALHACIDFFRIIQKVDFNDLFEIKSVFGEEAFCHYHKQFCDAISEAIE